MESSLSAVLGLGFVLGIRHAMDADHVAAVSTIVSQHRGVLRSCLLGTFWGIGHTLALLGAGIGVIGFKLTISPEVERALETIVACVLVVLGGRVLLKVVAGSLHVHTHADDVSHRHPHVHAGAHRHLHMAALGRRPLLLGLLHGLAGSAALMLMILGTISSPAAGVLYIAVFGVGSIAGMLVLSGVIGIPFALAAGRSTTAHAVVQGAAGTASMLVGFVLMWQLSG